MRRRREGVVVVSAGEQAAAEGGGGGLNPQRAGLLALLNHVESVFCAWQAAICPQERHSAAPHLALLRLLLVDDPDAHGSGCGDAQAPQRALADHGARWRALGVAKLRRSAAGAPVTPNSSSDAETLGSQRGRHGADEPKHGIASAPPVHFWRPTPSRPLCPRIARPTLAKLQRPGLRAPW